MDIDYDRFAHIPKVYVECKKDHALTLDAQRLMAAKYKCLHVALDTDHSPFLSTPKELVEILLHAD
ncbi:MAG: hypothetical protein JSS62_03035 [Verrucomicrobia bacterium]|nr:hypothetical protein [Verrucomicrobiota bacterium]MBS0646031.1 hypothetical protein [Verrucomicrobiota bacterium]